MSSIWHLAGREDQTYPPLRGSETVDVAVVGAGITGLATALKLAQAGKRVAVIEAHQVGTGATGGSTGNLYSTLSHGLAPVRGKWNDSVLREVVSLRGQAVDFVEEAARSHSIDCQFNRRPLYFCISEPDPKLQQKLDAEHEASTAAGLTAQFVDAVPGLSAPVSRALRIEDQAQFNPFAFTQGLANAVTELGGRIFEASRVKDVDASKGVLTCDGGEVRADNFVIATHTPKGINLVQGEMEPYMEHGVAAPLEAEGPEGIFWLLSHSQSIRSYTHEGKHYLVVVGEKHKTGEAGHSEHFAHLRHYAQRHFPVSEFSHQWSAQQFQAADLLPYIGQSAHKNVYIATGFAADGLAWGVVAAEIIYNQILGRDSLGQQLLDPKRFTPVKSAKNFIKQNVAVAQHMAKDYLSGEEVSELEQVPMGEGRIVKVDGDVIAAYRAPDDRLSLVSSVCPHMKCRVHWNGTDNTWDCPCHGSRFATDGRVLEGPAWEPLEPKSLDS